MEKKQQVEWAEAQKIVLSEDLVDVAKKQLKFLATVDRHRCLYDGAVLDRAIFRYKNYWLPLLAKHNESSDDVIPLVVPLDCEWIWHCHRLNPLRYKSDCEEFFGRILDNNKVLSSTVQGSPKQQTEEIWNKLYPEEPYELDLTSSFTENANSVMLLATASQSKSTQYDLVDAVKRQSIFFYQTSRPSMNDDLFLEEAVARYKGFLHLIKRNKERSIRRFCVPTYDIDLIWHSHQLNPISYSKDMVEIMGIVLEHDDTDPNKTIGQKLEGGFSGTTKQWEDTFGFRYWRAGAMYKNDIPSPITTIPWKRESESFIPQNQYPKTFQLPRKMVVEVLLEIVDVKNLPENHKENLFVLISKQKPDPFFSIEKRLSITSVSKKKQVASFQCEQTGELFLELMSHAPSSLTISTATETMGTISVPLNYMMDPNSKLAVDEWFELESSIETLESNPISLRVGVSLSVPAPAPHVFEIVQSHPGSTQHAKSWKCIIDDVGKEIVDIQMRESNIAMENKNLVMKKEIVGVVRTSGETHVLAECLGTTWYLVDSTWPSQIKKTCSEDGHIFELSGSERVVKLYPGRKLEFEAKSCSRHNSEYVFITAVEFSTENPYGKAVALFDLKSGVVQVNEDWFVLSGITLNFLLSNILSKEGYSSLIANSNDPTTKGTCTCGNINIVCRGKCGSGCDGSCGYVANGGAKGGRCWCAAYMDEGNCDDSCGYVANGGERGGRCWCLAYMEEDKSNDSCGYVANGGERGGRCWCIAYMEEDKSNDSCGYVANGGERGGRCWCIAYMEEDKSNDSCGFSQAIVATGTEVA